VSSSLPVVIYRLTLPPTYPHHIAPHDIVLCLSPSTAPFRLFASSHWPTRRRYAAASSLVALFFARVYSGGITIPLRAAQHASRLSLRACTFTPRGRKTRGRTPLTFKRLGMPVGSFLKTNRLQDITAPPALPGVGRAPPPPVLLLSVATAALPAFDRARHFCHLYKTLCLARRRHGHRFLRTFSAGRTWPPSPSRGHFVVPDSSPPFHLQVCWVGRYDVFLLDVNHTSALDVCLSTAITLNHYCTHTFRVLGASSRPSTNFAADLP